MRKFLVLVLICLIFTPCPVCATFHVFHKKDYKQIFLNNATQAEKRNNNKSAFHSYEKALFYYKKDKTVIESYAKFCERQKYFDRAENLYAKLYVLTKDTNYLFKKNLCAIKNGKLSNAKLQALVKAEGQTSAQRNELNSALIYHFSYKEDWKSVKKTCDQIPKQSLDKDSITTCIVASERMKDKKSALAYLMRYSELYPNDTGSTNKIIALAETFGDYPTQEKFIKRLSSQNPNDAGIKYRLAGFYEKNKEWAKAAKVYEALMVSGDRSEHVKKSYAYDILKIASSDAKDFVSQKKITKKLSELNPKDSGLKYRLAGLYERHGEWKKAAKVYEGLMASGDKSEHVKTSYAYVLTQLNPKTRAANAPIAAKAYVPKPLSGYKLHEKLFYEALKAKEYSRAQVYLDKMLKKQPKNAKLLKHQSDIAFAQNDYKKSIVFLEKVQKIKPLSSDDEKFLAVLYSKTENFDKSLEIAENLLQQNPNNKELLNSALEYSMAGENWDKAILYTDKLLVLEPNSEKLLKNIGDFYSIKKDFPNAIKAYEKLIENYPEGEYEFNLANLYMANQNFASAESIFEKLYKTNPGNAKITDAYLNSLLAEQKTKQAYWVIINNHLENTVNGYMVFGDMAMLDKDYYTARKYYKDALCLDSKNITILNKLANVYRSLKCICQSTQIYNQVLQIDSQNIDARLGLGSLEIDKKNYKKAREIFCCILKDKPDYQPAKIAIAHSYIANDDKLKALETLQNIPQDKNAKLLEANLYYRMDMMTDASKVLSSMGTNAKGEDIWVNTSKDDMPETPSSAGPVSTKDLTMSESQRLSGSVYKDSETLKDKIRRENAITITPAYSFFFQQLSDEFRLDYHKFGINVAKNVEGNKNVFMEYNNIIYSSGPKAYLNNVVNEFRVGVQARPTKEWEYKANIGVKAFEFGGGMLVTDSWIKRYFNDNFALKLGFKRNNIEQSYTSAVGQPIDGVFTGRSCDNKLYVETQHKLPKQFYAYTLGSFGVIYSQNMLTNEYIEAMAGLGRLLYNNPDNKWINTVSADLVSYNSSYQYNLLNLYSKTGRLYGGYFSPTFFSANTLNLKAEGNIKKWHLKYGVTGFGGIQNAVTTDQTTPTWGFSPYVAYDLNDNITINATYSHFTYADLVRDQFMINAVIRGFKKHAKN